MDENTNGQAVLFAKLARVMGKVRTLPKTGYNEHFKYHFVTDGTVSEAISSALAAENVAFIPSILESHVDGKITKTRFLFTFACGDTGAYFQATWEGEGMDNQDKGVSKSATSAVKYFLLKTFLVDTGEKVDDPDNDTALDSGKRNKSSDQPAKPRNQTPAKQQPLESPAPIFNVNSGPAFEGWIVSELALDSALDVKKALAHANGDTESGFEWYPSAWPYGIPEAIGACIAFKCEYDAARIGAFIDNAKRAGTFKNSAKVAFTPAYLESYRTLALKLAK